MKIDNYEIIDLLGKGGFSEVFLVKKDGKLYALKKFKSYISNLNKIKNEIESLKIMNNYKNSIRFYEAVQKDDFVYFVFDYVYGGDLYYQVLNNKKLTYFEATKLIKDIISQLEFIQKHNRLHFDITTYNIVKKEEDYYLIDWGISSKINTKNKVLHKGNKLYTAPEIYKGLRGSFSEIYSLACCIYFALCKKNIYDLKQDDTLEVKMFKHTYFKPLLEEIKDEKIRYLLYRMLEKNYKKRANFKEIKEILNDDFKIPKDYVFTYDKSAYSINLKDNFEVCQKLSNDKIEYARETLALFYEDGLFTNQNLVQAYITYKKGSFENFIPSISSLGVLYFKGKGVKQDFNMAYNLFKQSENYSKSQYFLGLMLEKNLCKDDKDFIYYYKKAAFDGFELALKKLEKFKIKVEFENIFIN